MSFDCSWLAYYGVRKSEVLAIAGFRDTGEIEEAPEAPANCAEIPTGWTVLYLNDSTYTPKRVGLLSATHAVLSVIVQEYVPLSAASFYVRSKQFWSVTHDGSKGVLDIQTSGTLPPEFSKLKDRLIDKQRDDGRSNVDHAYDLPIELAAMICGFRHDRFEFDWGQPKFTIAVTAR